MKEKEALPGISAVIITFNEEKNIGRCLDSLAGVADEIIVIDSFSTDKTKEICHDKGVIFIQTEWRGFSETKNFGNSRCSYDYVLSMDADEALSERLREEILRVKPNLEGVYSFKRLNNYCGKWIRHGGWYPDIKIRLFEKGKVFWDDAAVHENLVTGNAKNLLLDGDLLHYSYYSISEHVVRSDKYSSLGAGLLKNKSKETLLLKMLLNPVVRFFKMYFLKAGFRDGFYGFCIAAITAFEVFVKYAKALSRKKD